jgi:hypothetical protein
MSRTGEAICAIDDLNDRLQEVKHLGKALDTSDFPTKSMDPAKP